ncbi:hypothetical protein IAT38_004373 [Cryptococcus sp. DSM 104549]
MSDDQSQQQSFDGATQSVPATQDSTAASQQQQNTAATGSGTRSLASSGTYVTIPVQRRLVGERAIVHDRSPIRRDRKMAWRRASASGASQADAGEAEGSTDGGDGTNA